MATENFKDLLDAPLDSVKRPPLLPSGSYIARIKDYSLGKIGKNESPAVTMNYVIEGPGADLEGEDFSEIDFSTRKMSSNWFLTADAKYRLKEFLEQLGIDTKGQSFNATLPESVGRNVLLEINQLPRKDDPEEMFNNIKRVVAYKD